MSEKFSLRYFNRVGKIELVKLIFAVSNVKYEDNYIENLTDSDRQFGVMPFLEVNDERIPCISVISRFLAREFNLAGKNNLEQAKCDAIATNIMLLIDHYYDKVWEVEDRDQKKLGLKSFIDTEVQSAAEEVENLIKHYKTNKSDRFCIGNQLTYADLFIYEMATNYLPKDETFRDRFPLIQSVRNEVERDERVATFLKTVETKPEYLDINRL